MATFWSIHGTSLKRLFTGYCLIQLGISLILLYINRLTPQSALFLLVFQPIIVLCIGSASFGLRLARHTLPKLGCSPALWVGLSYVLTVLSDMPWHDPSLDPVLKWGGLGLMATLLVAFRCVWIASGRRLPLGQKVAIVGILTTFLSLGIFSLHSISHQQRTNQSQLRQELSAGLLLLGSQIEGGQQWQALMNFSPDAQIAVYSSDGSLQFYRGNEQSRRSVKELGWRLPAPSGSFLDEGKIVVWERLESGTILLARQNESGALEGLYSPLFGSLLSTAVVGLFVFGIAQDLSQQREESFEQILARLRDDHQASAYHTWDPDVQELADRLIDWAQDLRFQRDHLQTRVTSLARKTASQSRQIVTMGQRLETLRGLQESLRLESAVPMVAKHLERLTPRSTVRIWLYEAGRSLLVYGTEDSAVTDTLKVEVELVASSGSLGKVEFEGPDARENQRMLLRAVARVAPYLEQVKKVEEGEMLSALFHRLLEPRLPQTEGLRIAYKYVPSTLLSGDLLDVFPAYERGYVLVVADVLGKGPIAAATALRAKEFIRHLCGEGHSIGDVTKSLNSRIHDTDSRMLTLFIAHLQPETRLLTYCSAGHEEVYLRLAETNTKTLPATSMMLGVLPDDEFKERTVSLEGASQLLLYTDGVTECRDHRSEQFSSNRVKEVVTVGKSAVHTTELLMFKLRQHCAGEFQDDVSILCVEFP